MIFLSVLILSTVLEPSTAPPSHFQKYIEPAVQSFIDSAIYFGGGAVFGSVALVCGTGWALCRPLPEAKKIGDECLLASEILGTAALHSFSQGLKKVPLFSCFFKKTPSSYSAWESNKKMLSQVPAFSYEDKKLLHFLQARWLAKTTGCYPFFPDWMCPAFGISLQVHPETTNSYARDPATKMSDTYKNRLDTWKKSLPQPYDFPLILTHPADISSYLPQDSPLLIVDVTSMLPGETADPKEWLSAWHTCENQLSNYYHEQKIDINNVVCMQRVMQKDIGGIRLLPFSFTPQENTEKHYQFLLEWISRFGLSANRVELDRLFPACDILSLENASSQPKHLMPKETWVSCLTSLDERWQSNHPQKTLMFKGTLQVLKDLCTTLSEEQWNKLMNTKAHSVAAELYFTNIRDTIEHLIKKEKKMSFHQMTTHLEKIHADLSSLLEIFNPFTLGDFRSAFQRHLTSIPKNLQPLTQYGIHSSSMTSFAGIFKALHKTLGRPPRVLYGDNIYFECQMAIERVSKAVPILEANAQDWKDVDLILAQFNPTVKRISFKVTEYQATEYHTEEISDFLHKALEGREGRPLSIAIDGTLDFSNSARIRNLLAEFEKEIERGDLNFICYRSGLKFDLFGMDNYCGAPFYMIHNSDEKWTHFDSLMHDPVLATDRLSLNWFCLAYQNAASYLEEYRKQIFTNTRAVLNRIPGQLFDPDNPRYRVIPMSPDADPSFIDIKIFEPLHATRGGLLVASFLTLKCIQAGHPLLYRPGIAFYHPNLAVLYGDTSTTVRLTVGLDPAQIDVILKCMEKLSTLNGSLVDIQ